MQNDYAPTLPKCVRLSMSGPPLVKYLAAGSQIKCMRQPPERFMSQTMHQPLPNVYTSACLDHPLLILQPSYKSNVCDSPRAFYESDIRCWEKPDTAPCKANEYFLGITEEGLAQAGNEKVKGNCNAERFLRPLFN